MTLREVQSALRCITKRRHDEAKFEAAVHGVQLRGGEDAGKPLTPEKASLIERQMRAAMEMKRREARARHG